MLRKKKDGILGVVLTIVYAAIIALGVRTLAYEPFNIPSGSMIPTLLVGDYLFVSKFSYGYSRYSAPFSPALFEGRIFARSPKRGDVVVFRLPRDVNIDYIKRVIGLPGDRIQMKRGRLFIDGKMVNRRQIEDFVIRDPNFGVRRFAQFIETLPGGARHRIIEVSDTGSSDNTPEYTVPEGYYFMMGDNRDNSDDSRGGVGFVPFENIVGRAEVLFFSIDTAASIWKIWTWPMAVRWPRIFDSLRPGADLQAHHQPAQHAGM